MFAFHSVTYDIGHGLHKLRVFNDLNIGVADSRNLIVLGHAASGKTAFLKLLDGREKPTQGWVEKRGTFSPLGGLARFATPTTTIRGLIAKFARIYKVDVKTLTALIEWLCAFDGRLERQLATLPPQERRLLDYALVYGIPFDHYLFDGSATPRNPRTEERFQQVLADRMRTNKLILTTRTPRLAAAYKGSGAIVGGGKMRLYPTVAEAIDAFNKLPPPLVIPLAASVSVAPDEEEVEI